MWPFTSYPEYSVEDVAGETFDYIVVGGGTAGCVIASRLSEDPNVSVLLIERGRVKNNLVSRMPLLSQNKAWTNALQIQNTIWSEPVHRTNGRTHQLWAANALGGCTRINAMLWTRGCPGEYNSWSDMGLDEWSWEKVEPYFKRLEKIAWPLDKSHPDVRGRDGKIDLCKPNYPFQWRNCLGEAAKRIGLPILDDCNDPGKPFCGYFPLETAIDQNGERVTASTAFLSESVARERIQRLRVCTGTVASRLEISEDKEDGHVVTGVFIRPSNPSSQSGKEFLVKARREVILSCGAMTTPQLLLLSGIGPQGECSVESTLGIPIVKNLPVGVTFSDHFSIPMMVEIARKETLHILENTIWALWYIILWIFTGAGFVGKSAATDAVFLHSDTINPESMQVMAPNADTSQSHQVPNIEIIMIPGNSFTGPVPGRSMLSFYPVVVQPHATGRLEISSTDPLVNPKIFHPMFSHEEDVRVARLGVRLAMRFASEFEKSYPHSARFAFAPGNNLQALAEWEKQGGNVTWPSEKTSSKLTANKTWRDVTDDEIDDYIRRVGQTALHYSCTCPMGTDESNGVVNQGLLVFGFENLRIADASVFPKITSAHTMAPVLMVAERCADFIKSTWEDSK